MANDLRLDKVWEAVRTRLTTARMGQILYLGEIFRATQAFESPENAEDRPWGRIVLVPTTTLWNTVDVPGETAKINFLVRIEFNNFGGEGYDPTTDLEQAQEEVWKQLQNWEPTGIDGAFIAFHFYRRTRPQPMPFFDNDQKVWWTSAEYRFEALAVPALIS